MRRVLALYRWNAQISAAFIVPLHFCEVITRNAIVEAIEQAYGAAWFTEAAFERALPKLARQNLIETRRGRTSAGEIVAELKVFFWAAMLTSRHDQRLWNAHLRTQFPNLPAALTIAQGRKLLHEQLEIVRRFRNRVAHHEPVFMRNLAADYRRLKILIAWRSETAADWLDSIEGVTELLSAKP